MGGLIIRSALPRLEKHKDLFHSLITLSSPHLGYGYSSSKLVDVGLWFMNTVKKLELEQVRKDFGEIGICRLKRLCIACSERQKFDVTD